MADPFDVFISYSRRDKAFAVRLQKALSAHVPPAGLGLPRRALRVFRDESDLTGAEYHEAIGRYLEAAGKLVVICSPQARASTYVDDEVRRFIGLHGAGNVAAVWIAGSAARDAPLGEADDRALPRALLDAMAMPLAVSYRDFDLARNRIDGGAFYGSWCTLLANLLDRSRAEIEQRESRRRRRRAMLLAGAVSGVVIALSTSLVVALLARNEATRQRDVAEQRRQVAEGRRLGVESRDLQSDHYDLALLLAGEALRISPSFETRDRLRVALDAQPSLDRVLHGHDAALVGMVARPDGQAMVTLDRDGHVIVRPRDGSAAGAVLEVGKGATALAMHPRENLIAVASESGLALWSLDDGRRVAQAPGPATGTIALAFSPDGALLASGDWDGATTLWETRPALRVSAMTLDHPPPQAGLSMARGVHALAFDPGGRLLASAGGDERVVVRDVQTGRLVGTALGGFADLPGQLLPGLSSVAFSPSGDVLAAGGLNGEIRLWQMPGGKAIGDGLRANGVRPGVRSLAFDAGGNVLFTGNEDGAVHVWGIPDQRPLDQLAGHAGPIAAVRVDSDRQEIRSAGEDGKVIVWLPHPGSDRSRLARPLDQLDPDAPRNVLRGLRHRGDMVHALAYSRDGAKIATGSDDGNLVVRDVSSGRELERGKALPGALLALAFTPDGRCLAVGGEGDTVALRCPGAAALELPGHGRGTSALAFDDTGRRLAAGTFDGATLVWDLPSRRPVARLAGAKPVVYAAFSPQSGQLQTLDEAGRVASWDVASGKPVAEHALQVGDVTVAFDVDGRRIAAPEADGHVITVRDVATWQPVGKPFEVSPQDLTAVALGPDGSRLAISSGNQITLWDVAKHERVLAGLSALQGRSRMAFSPDGRTLAVSGMNPVVLWDVSDDAATRRACEIAGRNLSPAELSRYLIPSVDCRLCPRWPGVDGPACQGDSQAARRPTSAPPPAGVSSAGR